MANVTLTPQNAVPSGITTTRTGSLSTENTYLVPNDGRVILMFQKSEAVDATVAIPSTATLGGLTVADQSVTVGASSGDVVVGPFPPAIYNSSGNLSFTSDNVAGLTVAAVRI